MIIRKHLPSIYSCPLIYRRIQSSPSFTTIKIVPRIISRHPSYIKPKSTNAAATTAPVDPTLTALAAPLKGTTLDEDAAALVPAAADPDAATTVVGLAVALAAAADEADARMEL